MLFDFFAGSFLLVYSGVVFRDAHRNLSLKDALFGLCVLAAGLYFIVALVGHKDFYF